MDDRWVWCGGNIVNFTHVRRWCTVSPMSVGVSRVFDDNTHVIGLLGRCLAGVALRCEGRGGAFKMSP
jgi:hypothetical protein